MHTQGGNASQLGVRALKCRKISRDLVGGERALIVSVLIIADQTGQKQKIQNPRSLKCLRMPPPILPCPRAHEGCTTLKKFQELEGNFK